MKDEYIDLIKVTEETIKNGLVTFIRWLPNLIVAILVLTLFYFIWKCTKKYLIRWLCNTFPNMKKGIKLVSSIANGLFWFFTVILILDILKLSNVVTHFLAGAGIAGIIAGFAFKDVASNAFAGLLIRSQSPFVVGDWIKINQDIGQVKKIGLVGTWVQTNKGRLLYIPNQMIFNSTFINYSTFGKVKIFIDVGVSYGDDLDQVEEVSRQVMNSLPMVLKDHPMEFFVRSIGSSTYNCQLRYWIEFKDRVDLLKAESDGIRALKKAYEKANICVAYNVTTLDFGVKGGVNIYDKDLKIINYPSEEKEEA